MTKQHRLFELIRSLTKAEKRHFKLYVAGNGKHSNYLQLFDAIDKQARYDEQLIKAQFKGQVFIRQIHGTKNYLYQLILKSLGNFHNKTSIDATLRELLQAVEILFRKELLDHCEIKLNKAEKLAQQYEKHTSLLEILAWKRKLLLSRHAAAEIKPNVEAVLEQERQSIKKIDTVNQYWSRIINIFQRHSGNCDAVKNDPLLSSIEYANTLQAKILFYHIRYSDSLFNQNTQRAEDAITQLINLLEQHPERIREDPMTYITAINNHISLLLHNKQLARIPKLLDKIRTIPKQYKLDEKHPLAVRSVLRTYNVELEMYRDTRQFAAGIALIKNINPLLEKHHAIVPREYFLLFNYQFAYMHFLQRDYPQSLYWLNTLAKHNVHGIREDILTFARWLTLINHFELNHIDVLKYAVDTTRHFLNKKRELFEYEKILLTFFSQLSVSPDNRYPLLFKALYTTLFESDSNLVPANVLDYLNLKHWINYKLSELNQQQ